MQLLRHRSDAGLCKQSNSLICYAMQYGRGCLGGGAADAIRAHATTPPTRSMAARRRTTFTHDLLPTEMIPLVTTTELFLPSGKTTTSRSGTSVDRRPAGREMLNEKWLPSYRILDVMRTILQKSSLCFVF